MNSVQRTAYGVRRKNKWIPAFAGMTTVILLILTALLLVPQLANAKKAPDWTNGSSKEYSEPRYFIGVGAVSMEKGGGNQQLTWASDHARAEIAKTLRAKISSTTSATREVESVKSPKPSSSSKQTDTVTVVTNEILDGVEIKEIYRDKKEKMLYALAILDRPVAAKRIQKQVDDIKQEMLTEVDAGKGSQNANDVLPAIRHYNKALSLAGRINEKNELLAVLNPVGITQIENSESHAADIRNILYGLKKQIRFEVKVEGPAAGVKNYVVQGLSGGGFAVTGKEGSQSATKTYQLVGTTDLTYKGEMQMGKNLAVQVYQADLDLEILDPKTNESVGALTWSVPANEKSSELASKSSVRALGRTVQKDIADKILNMF